MGMIPSLCSGILMGEWENGKMRSYLLWGGKVKTPDPGVSAILVSPGPGRGLPIIAMLCHIEAFYEHRS
jgi:hypothetical protein